MSAVKFYSRYFTIVSVLLIWYVYLSSIYIISGHNYNIIHLAGLVILSIVIPNVINNSSQKKASHPKNNVLKRLMGFVTIFLFMLVQAIAEKIPAATVDLTFLSDYIGAIVPLLILVILVFTILSKVYQMMYIFVLMTIGQLVHSVFPNMTLFLTIWIIGLFISTELYIRIVFAHKDIVKNNVNVVK